MSVPVSHFKRKNEIGELAVKFNQASDTEKQEILVETVQHLPEHQRDEFIELGFRTDRLERKFLIKKLERICKKA